MYNRGVRRILILALLAGAAVWPQDSGPIAAVRAHVSEAARRMPNFTCLQNVERSASCYVLGSVHCETSDRLRLEVAVVNGRERFAFAGEASFENTDIRVLAPGAMTARGDYIGYLLTIAAAETVISYQGSETRSGRVLLRYGFRSDTAHGHVFQVVRGPKPEDEQSVRAAVEGSFWVDEATLELQHLEASAVPPPHSIVAAAHTKIEYGAMQAGESTYVLPRSTDQEVRLNTNEWNHNRTVYSGCRQYEAQSSIRFDEPSAAEAAGGAQAGASPVKLPPGSIIMATLAGSIDPRRAAVGDPVIATVTAASGKDGKALLAARAEVRGRITQMPLLAVRMPSPTGLVATRYIGLRFSEFRYAGASVRFEAPMESATSTAGWGAETEKRDALFQSRGDAEAPLKNVRFVWRIPE